MPVKYICTIMLTLVYLIEVPALMQNIDWEEREINVFFTSLSINSKKSNESVLNHLHWKETIIMKYWPF